MMKTVGLSIKKPIHNFIRLGKSRRKPGIKPEYHNGTYRDMAKRALENNLYFIGVGEN